MTQPITMQTEKPINIWDEQGFLVNVKSGQYGRVYQVFVDGELKGNHSTPDGSVSSHTTQINTDVIINGLANSLASNNCVVLEEGDSWLYFKPMNTNKAESIAYTTVGTHLYKVPDNVYELFISGKASGAGGNFPKVRVSRLVIILLFIIS